MNIKDRDLVLVQWALYILRDSLTKEMNDPRNLYPGGTKPPLDATKKLTKQVTRHVARKEAEYMTKMKAIRFAKGMSK